MASSPEPQKPEDNWDDWSDDALKTGTPPDASTPPAAHAAPAGAVAQNAGAKPAAKTGGEGEGDDWFNELFTEEAAGNPAAGTPQSGAPQGDWPSALFGESPQASESGGSLFNSVAGAPAPGPAPTVTKEKRGQRNQRNQPKAPKVAAARPPKAPGGGLKSPVGVVALFAVVLVVGLGGFEYKHFTSTHQPPADTAAPPAPAGAPAPGAPGIHTPPGAPPPAAAGMHTPPGAPPGVAGMHMPPGAAPPMPGAVPPGAAGAHTPPAMPAAGMHVPPGAATAPANTASVSDADFKSNLKAIWNQGANAKHAHNNFQAKVFWNQGLREAQARPGFASSAQGFQDSLAQLKDPT